MSLTPIITKPEASLPDLAPARKVDIIRAVDDQGNSVNATPAQVATAIAEPIKPLLGIDKSLLTEQIIPGEFFVGRDGTRKQVYGAY